MANTPARRRVPLTGISSRAWEHPADRGALVALRKLRGFDSAIKLVNSLFRERANRLAYLGSAVRVDERQFARLHTLLADVGTVLDTDRLPEMYVVADPGFNAMTIGMDAPIIVLSSGLLDALDVDELRFVIGHELGHAMSGHAVYRTLLLRLLQLANAWSAIPLAGLAFRGVVAALMEWSRKSELSADRAGLLAAQDPAAALRVHMKLASGGHPDDLDQASFLAQGQEYDDAVDLRDALLKLMLVEAQTHPFMVMRATALRRWIDTGEYTAILGGTYPRRDEDPNASVSQAAEEAAAAYTDAFRASQDAVGKAINDAAGWVGAARMWWDSRFGPRDQEKPGA